MLPRNLCCGDASVSWKRPAPSRPPVRRRHSFGLRPDGRGLVRQIAVGGADLGLRWSGSIESAADLPPRVGLWIIDGRPAGAPSTGYRRCRSISGIRTVKLMAAVRTAGAWCVRQHGLARLPVMGPYAALNIGVVSRVLAGARVSRKGKERRDGEYSDQGEAIPQYEACSSGQG